MFQSPLDRNENLKEILATELDYFKSILEFSEKFAEQAASLPVNVLSNMVNYRQEWIEKIQSLETKRQHMKKAKPDKESERYLKQISDIAENLVEIDKEIYQKLEKRKIKFVQQHTSMTTEANYSLRQAKKQHDQSSRLDLMQE